MSEQMLKVAVIGGGAAGFFAALSCKAHYPDAAVTIYEKSDKLLAKVKVSGGGRCNVTHACFTNSELLKYYPRGRSFLKSIFRQFSTQDTVDWFEQRGVNLNTEADGRMFPTSNKSQTIIDCLLQEAERLGVEIAMKTPVTSAIRSEGEFKLTTKKGTVSVDKVIIATGGSPKLEGLQWLADIGHDIVPPVPSLFTFNMPNEPITELMGVVANDAVVGIQGSKLNAQGPLLITHWGMSGPAILKLSAFGARELADFNYQFKVQVNWLGSTKEHELREQIPAIVEELNDRQVRGKNPFELANRLWLHLIEKAGIESSMKWVEVDKKGKNRLMNILTNDVYEVSGKTTFKEEFVTCGGVSLASVDKKTMQSQVVPGMYFTGEVLDIDGVTGGFNFQAAWSTGFVAGKLH